MKTSKKIAKFTAIPKNKLKTVAGGTLTTTTTAGPTQSGRAVATKGISGN